MDVREWIRKQVAGIDTDLVFANEPALASELRGRIQELHDVCDAAGIG